MMMKKMMMLATMQRVGVFSQQLLFVNPQTVLLKVVCWERGCTKAVSFSVASSSDEHILSNSFSSLLSL
jgi:hypothetical protein